MRGLADEGRTVLVSSHLMSEMQQTADHLVIIGRGRLIADASIDAVLQGTGAQQVRVRTPRSVEMQAALRRRDVPVRRVDDRELDVAGLSVEDVGDLALELGIPVHGLTALSSSLEQAFLDLTESSLEYRGTEARA